MSGGRRMMWAGALVAFAAAEAGAFVFDINASGQARRWVLQPPDGRVPTTAVNRSTRAIIYRLDGAAYSETNTVAELDAIRAAFDQWQRPDSHLRFEEGPLLSNVQDVDSNDGVNSLFWARTLFVNGGRDNLSGVTALTYVKSFADGNVIAEADTVFNGAQFRWFTDYFDNARQDQFVEAIALHEIGHFIGLRHSPVGGATMLFAGDFGVNSQLGLSEDERCALRALYPAQGINPAPARINGSVRAQGQAVFGAAVFAEDARGNVMAGTVSREDGSFTLSGLPPDSYVVRAAPLDPASGGNYLIRGSDIASTYRNANTSFLPAADSLLTLAAGQTSELNIEVGIGAPLRIVRVLRPAADLSNPAFHNKPVNVQPAGQTVYLGVLTPAALNASAQFHVTGDGLALGPTETRASVLGNLSLAAAPVTVSATATPGLRSFRLELNGAVAWAHGFLEILPPYPDFDEDGLDDRFQRQFWTRFTAPEADPESDPDNDGFNNAWEAATGSDPTDPQSARFRIESVRVTAEGARVRSETAPGRMFQLHARETLPGSPWQPVGNPVRAEGAMTEFLDPAAQEIRFYRVALVE